MKIIKIESSTLKTKRFKIYLDNGSSYNFGLKGGSTYIDHHDKGKRRNYRLRHLGNEREKELITNYTPSPALFSYYLLWGEYADLNKNVRYLNNKLNEYYS